MGSNFLPDQFSAFALSQFFKIKVRIDAYKLRGTSPIPTDGTLAWPLASPGFAWLKRGFT